MRAIAIAVAVSLIALQAAADCERVVSDRQRLLIEHGAQRTVLVDVPAITMPRWSPTGDRIAYVRRSTTEHPFTIFVIQRDGKPVGELSITADFATNAVMEMGWLDETRVWFEGHINPSVSRYYVWDVARDSVSEPVFGTWFTPSPDGKHLAYLEHLPHGSPWPRRLIVDGEVVQGNDGKVSELTWSADATQLLFTSDRRAHQLDLATRRVTRLAVAMTSLADKEKTRSAFFDTLCSAVSR